MIIISLKKLFYKIFLPNDFPKSVSNDYLEYQCWDSLQAFCSSIMNNLATQAILRGAGVGDSNATVLAATITWILKDGTSIIGSLIFAAIQCTRLDSDCKRWRLFADVMNDLAIMLDLCSGYLFVSVFNFTLIQCCSGVLRSLVGVAGGATRAAITQHQAKCNNMADVSAKDQSQERIVNLIALILSLVIIPLVSGHHWLIWIMFLLLSIGHIYSNYRAVRSLRFNVFNLRRFALFCNEYFNGNLQNLSIKWINQQENVWFYPLSLCFEHKHERIFENIPIIYHQDDQDDFNPKQILENLFQIYIKKLNSIGKNKSSKDLFKLIGQNDWSLDHVLMAENILNLDNNKKKEN